MRQALYVLKLIEGRAIAAASLCALWLLLLVACGVPSSQDPASSALQTGEQDARTDTAMPQAAPSAATTPTAMTSPPAQTATPSDVPDETRVAVQRSINESLLRATIIAATVEAVHSGPAVPPSTATAIAEEYERNIATLVALGPTAAALNMMMYQQPVDPPAAPEATLWARASEAHVAREQRYNAQIFTPAEVEVLTFGGLPPYPNIAGVDSNSRFFLTDDSVALVSEWYLDKLKEIGGTIVETSDRDAVTTFFVETPHYHEMFRITIWDDNMSGKTGVQLTDLGR